jgi:hypothetical protein
MGRAFRTLTSVYGMVFKKYKNLCELCHVATEISYCKSTLSRSEHKNSYDSHVYFWVEKNVQKLDVLKYRNVEK